MAAVLFSLAACWGLPGESRSPGAEQALQSNLSVASAALAAGQPAVAQRLYLALAERFEDAPEPALGLGYVALRGNNPGEAGEHFLRAASLADDAPGMKAEALLGAARASLSQGDSSTAQRHLSAARDLARDPSSVAWIENGLAVAAVFEEDYVTAEAHYVSALRQPSAHPRIAANYVRMLIASERIDDAARTLAAHAPSRWEENDRQALQSLIDEARRSQPAPDRLDPRLLLRLAGSEPSSAGMDERSVKGVRRVTLGPRGASPGMVLLAGSRSIPLAGRSTAATPDPALADRISSERAPEETTDPVPASLGTAPESLLPVQEPESEREAPPSLKTIEPDLDRSSTRASFETPALSDMLALRIGPAASIPDETPDDVAEPATGARLALVADAGIGSRAIAFIETGGHGVRLLSLAGSPIAPASSEFAEPQAVPVPAPVERRLEAEAVPAAASGLAATGGEAWTHYLGPDPAQSANALLLAAASRYDSGPSLANSELPSSPVSLGPKPVTATATADETRDLASLPTPGLRSTALEDEGWNDPESGPAPVESAASSPDLLLSREDAATAALGAGPDAVTASGTAPPRLAGDARLLRWDMGPAPTESVTLPNGYGNHDQFSAVSVSYKPILLASASPHLDDFLWRPEWMQAERAPHVRDRTMVTAEGADDPLAQTAEAAGTGAPAPGGEWSVLLGTGQRLSLEAAAAAVAVASPEIADVQLLSPRVLFVMGRNLGRTTVSVLGEDGSLFERDVTVVLDLEPLRTLLAGEPGLQGVRVDGLARGVALTGDVDSQEAADRALRLAAASLPESVPVESNLIVGLDLSPLRTLLAGETGLEGVEVRRVGRGVALTGEVTSAEAADRAYRLAAASLPAGLTVENNLRVVFDVEPLREVLAAEAGLDGVEVKRLTRGVALSGAVDSPEAANRALRLATASLPDGLLVENNLNVELDLLPLRAALAGEPGLHRVHPRRLARGVVLTGEVDTPGMADRAFRVATASLPEGVLVESNLNVELDLSPLSALIASEPGLENAEVQPDGDGVALTGEVASTEAADRAYRLAAASLPDGTPVENRLRLAFDAAPLRAALEKEPGLGRVHLQRLARNIVLSGDVDSPEAESRALRLAAASLPEGVPVESELQVGPDLESLRALLTGEPGLAGVEVQRIGRGVALTGEVASAEAADRAHRLAVASLPESPAVENNLRVVFDIEPLVALLAMEPGLDGVQVTRLARGVALAGAVDSPEAADRALRLGAASLPEGLLVENNLNVELSLLPLRALLAGEPGLHRVEVRRVGRGVALTGEVGSADAAERARRLAVASLPENVPVENNLHVALDVEPLRELLAREPGLDRVHVERLARGVALSGDVDSPETAHRALRLAAASLPDDLPVENNLEVALDLSPLQALMAGETGLGDVRVQRIGRGVALTGEVDSAETAERAADLAAASLLGAVPLENHLRVVFDVGPLRRLLIGESDLGRVRVQRLARGVALTGEVESLAAADRALRLATASLPAGAAVENHLRVVFDIEPLRDVLAAEPGLERVQVQRLARGIALRGDVDSPEAADLALRLSSASLPEGLLVENNLDVGLDLEPIRALMADEPGLGNVQVQRIGRGVALTGEVAAAEASDRAHRLALASLPENVPLENYLWVVDLEPLRGLIAREAGLQGVRVESLARGMTLEGGVASQEAVERALDLAAASLPDGMPVENDLRVVDLEPLRTLMSMEPGLQGVRAEGLARGVTLGGEVASQAAVQRALDLAAASLPDGMPVENDLRVVDLEPLRALMSMEAGLQAVRAEGLARGVILAGEVASQAAAERALDLAAASLPDGMPVESDLRVVDLEPLREAIAMEPGLQGVRAEGLARGITLAGEVASQAAVERALDLAAASLPDGMPVENDLRVVDLEPLRELMAMEAGLQGVRAEGLANGVTLMGEVASQAAVERALDLAAASLPDGMPVANDLRVVDLEPLRELIAMEAGLQGVRAEEFAGWVTLMGEVASQAAVERALDLAAASLPDGMPVANDLRVVDLEPLRELMAAEPGLGRMHVQRLAHSVSLSGDVDSPEVADRALDLAAASLPEGIRLDDNLNVGLGLASLRTALSGEAGLEGVQVLRVGRGVALTGEVSSPGPAERAHRLAVTSLPEGTPFVNNLRIVFDMEPLRIVLAAEPGLEQVRVQRLARGVSLTGDVASLAAAERAVGLAIASLPEGLLMKDNLDVGLDLSPLRALLAEEPGQEGVEVRRVGRGIALTGEVASAEAADRAHRLAVASLPETVPVESSLRVAFDLEPLRALLSGEPGLHLVHVRRLPRGAALTGEVASPAAADLALRLAAASLPAGAIVENNLAVWLDLRPVRALMAGEAAFAAVRVQRVGAGVALSGEVPSAEAADRAYRLAVASLPESLAVENNLRVVFDIEPLVAVLAMEPGLDGVQVTRLARGVALAGRVDSPEAADRALRLAAASLPEGLLVEDNLNVGLDLEPLRARMADEPGLRNVRVERIGRGVLLTGEAPSAAASDRAHRLALTSLPESVPLENNLRVVDLEPLRALLAAEDGLQGVRAEGLERGIALVGEVASQAAVERVLDLAAASLPEGMPVAGSLRLVDLEPLRAVLAAEPGLQGVSAEGHAEGVTLAGEVASQAAVERTLDLAAASLPEGMPVANGLRLVDLRPLRAALAAEPGMKGVRAEGIERGVSLSGEVASQAAVERALDLAGALLPEGVPVANELRLVDLEPLRALLAAEAGLQGVRAERIARGVSLSGEVASQAAVDQALAAAAASLPEGMPVANDLRPVDLDPLRALLTAEAGLDRVHVQGSRRSVSLSGGVDSPELADRALRLAAASLPEDIPVEDNLNVGLGLASLRTAISGEPGLEGVQVQRVGRGVALSGRVVSADAAERTYRLAAAALPEGTPVANNLRVRFDIEPLRAVLALEPGLERVQMQRLARGVALAGDVDSPEAADLARRLAAASLPEGLSIENNLTVDLNLAPLRALLAREQGLEGVRVQQVGGGIALTGEVAWAEAAERSYRLATASLPEGTPVENNLRVLFELAHLRTVLAGEPGLDRVQVQRLARGVALAGEVDSAADADRALRLAAASLPEGLLVENNLSIGLDLGPLRALLAGEPGSQDLSPLGAFMTSQPGLEGVAVQRVGRGIALTGEVASAEAADRAHRLAAASLPETVPVENNLRVLFDIEPVRAALAAAPGLEQVSVQRLSRGVALSGEVDSAEAEDRARRLAAASLPEGLLVENNLTAALDLAPLRTFMADEPGLAGVDVQRVGRSVALSGEVASAEAADRALGLAVASLPEGLPVENNLRVVFDIEPLRRVLAAEPGLDRVQAKRLARGVALAGEVDSPETADRALRLARASLPEGLLVEDNLSVVWEVEPTRALLAAEPGLEGVLVQRVGRGLALTGEVASAEAAGRAHRLAVASLPEGLPVENNLRVVFDFAPLRAILAGEPELARVQVQGLAGGVVLTGEVASEEAAERAQRIAAASLPEGVPVENSLRVLPDIEPLRLVLAAEPGLERVQVQRLARGVALSGEVDSPVAEDRALRLAAASLPEGVPVENNLDVGLDLGPLRSVVAGDPELSGVRVERTGRGVALIGEVGSAAAAEQVSRLAAALLPEGVPVEAGLRVVLDIGPLRALLAGAPELDRVEVQRLARGVALTGDVDSHAAADLALRLATASLPEGMLVESSLNVRLDLAPLRVLLAGDPELRNVRVKPVGSGVALTGEAGSAEASDRAARLAAAALPEGIAVENNLRVAPDVEPLRALLAGEPGLERVHVQKLVRGVALAGDVASPEAAGRVLRLAAASLPEGMLVEDNLTVGLDLGPLRALMAAEVGFEAILVKRVDRGVALTGEVGSQVESERAARLAAASLHEGALVENNLRTVLDTGPLRAALAADPDFDGVRVRDLEHGVSLAGEVSSSAAAERAQRLAAVSLPPDTTVENELRIAGPLQVNLEVQIAEVQRSIAEDFGFNWELFGRSAEGDLGGGFRIGQPLPPPAAVGGVGGPGTIPPSVVDGLTSPSLVLSRTWEEIGVTGMVDALAKAGLANVLARPNVTANSGEIASFFSGGEFPLPSGFKDGVIVFEYKKYGVVLDFVPTIVDEGRIELTVRPEVSEPSRDNSVQVTQGIDVPVINVRRAETTVALGDGESIVIAGLFSSASNEVQSGVPVLKDLPLVGGMFGHTSTRADELELIVTVTARLVQAGPAPDEALAAGSGQAANSYYY